MAYAQKRKLPKKKSFTKKLPNPNNNGELKESVDAPHEDDELLSVAGEPIDGEEKDVHITPAASIASSETDAEQSASEDVAEEDSAAEDAGEEEDTASKEKEDSDDDDDLSSIYGIDDENPIDMTKLDQKHSRGRWVVGTLIILALLGAVVYMGYRVFHTGGSKSGTVALSIQAEDRIASGDVVTLDIEYTNTKNVDITSGTLEVFYPSGFQFHSANVKPADENNRSWAIGNTKPGAGGKIRIVGQLVGAKDDVKDFSVLLTYRPSNFSQDFQETAKTSVLITSSIVDLTVDVPSQTASDQEITYTVSYTNTSKIALHNVKMLMEYPDGFTFGSASLQPWAENNEWRVDTLQAGETQTLTITGTLSGDSGTTKEFDFQLGIIEIDNSFDVQVSKSSLVVMVNPEVDLSIDAPETVHAGDEVPIAVTVKNTSDAKLKGVEVQLSFTGALFSETEQSFDTIKELSPDEEKTLTMTVPLSSDSTSADQELGVTAKVVSAHMNGSSVTFPNQADATIKVAGELVLTAEGRYFDENLTKIGSGPIPPTVGKKTTYVIQWSLSNQQNSMGTVRVVTTLPANVTWESDASNSIAYDSETRQVSFTKDALAANADASLHFAVSVTPTSSDLNKLLVLTNETTLSAQNTFTGEQVTQQIARITTDLPNDEGASGKGVVQK